MVALYQFDIKNLPLIRRGKVRDLYNIDDKHMLIVATDRLSAFDVVLPDAVPDKGKILTQLSNFWFNRTQHIISNHLTSITLNEIPLTTKECDTLQNRSVIVNKLQPLPIEAIVRGYLIGSGWDDYKKTGEVSGVQLPLNLKQAEQLPTVIFTPSTKANNRDHDQNISFEKMCSLVGNEIATQVRKISISLYQEASIYARQQGIIIADTKFEFGIDKSGQIILIDEILTPDSSRFWLVNDYQIGSSPPSLDKQYIRDYLNTLDWNKTAPGPHLPKEIIANTRHKYIDVAERLIKSNNNST